MQSNSPAYLTHPAHPRNLQQNVLCTGLTSILYSTLVKASSRPILTGFRVLVDTLQLITSLSMMMPNLWYMCPESVQLLGDPCCMRNLMSSLTKVLLFQLKSLLIGSLHMPTLGKQMGNYESVWTQKILIQLLEKITHELAGSSCFTKLDGTSSYLCIVFNYQSSLLMTFNTPWGRFRLVCLPRGLACAQEIFQQMMHQILAHCDGVIGIADDVVVHRKDDKEHDKCLHKFMSHP